MSIFARLGGKQRQTPDDRGQGLQRTWSQAPRSETTRLPALYHQSPRLDPVELIASTIAGAPLELFDRAKYRKDPDNAEHIENHPFYELMDSPSVMFPELDGYALKYLTVVLTELLGECFWVKIRAGTKVAELLPFPPAWCIMTPTQSNPRFMFQPFGTTAARTINVEPADVVWFKQPDLTDPYGRGRGRTEAVGGELDADEMAEKWQRNYYYNDATPPFWANIPGAQTAELERMRDTWSQRLGGWLNTRKPAFTNGENVQITKLGESAKEMDFVESRRYLRDVFLQHYSIPPELFGILENSNRSTIDAAYYLFAKNVIAKRLGFYERAITKQLIECDYDNRLIAKFDFEIPEDEVFKLQKVNAGLAAGALTRADWKRAMGYKAEPGDDVYLVPYSIMEVPKGTPFQDAAPEETTIDIADEPTDETIPIPENVAATALNGAQVASLVQIAQAVADELLPYETALEIVLSAYPTITRGEAERMLKPLINFGPSTPVELPDVGPPAPTKSAKAPDARKAAHWKAFDARAKSGEGMFRSRTRAFADIQSERVKKALKAHAPKDYKAAIDEAFAGADDALTRAYAPAWIASMTDGAEIGRGYLGQKISPSFALYNRAFDIWVKKNGLKKAKEINETTNEKLLKALDAELAEGIAAGESIPNLAARMITATEGVYENMSTARAELISKTEAMASVNFGQQVVYQSEGIEKKEWLATSDSDTREAHAALDGTVIGIDDSFDVPGYDDVPGEKMMYPGGGDVAGQNCNCRCTLLPVIER